jgi:hypothetical protein
MNVKIKRLEGKLLWLFYPAVTITYVIVWAERNYKYFSQEFGVEAGI